ncbi:hypothetical protein HYALB_00012527 [Hymenoscyphus albidus]|uniref:Tyrosine specific protein phosphatases domain-containing protein n=1 Tax=Hymenoscyphus albidus TaxID=595503 RepID=A0A9N9LK96_9HELO|nr:hypothetical protein HYALB_00012527 [Hymenoscyphus albidus]
MSATNSIPSSSTLPSPPFINIPNIPNFRDLGGHPLPTSSHTPTTIKPGLIYRCAEPSGVTQEGIAKLKELGVTHVYDLRSDNEIERSIAAGRGGVVEWDGCKRVFVPVFPDKDYDPEALAVRFKDYSTLGTEGFKRAYTSILKNAGPSYGPIFLHLANEPEKPLIVHCTAGKDRTGVFCALILQLCGVGDEHIAQEYSLTEIGLSKEWKEAVIEHLSEHPALKGNMEGAWNMISSKTENMLATLQIIRERFGGPEKYMTDICGLTKEQVEKIRSNLTYQT